MAHWIAFLSVLLASGNAIVSKMAVGVIAPTGIAFYRWFFAVLVLTPWCLPKVIKQRKVIKNNFWKIAVLAFLGMAFSQLLAYYAARTTSAANLGLIFSLVPVLSIFLGALLLRQRIGAASISGAVISFFGLAYLLGHGDVTFILKQGMTEGDFLMLISAASYALYSVLFKRWSIELDNWLSVYLQGLCTVVMLSPLLFFSDNSFPSYQSAGLIAYTSLMASVMAPWLWMKAIDSIGVSASAMYVNLFPLFTLILAALILGEPILHSHITGGVLVVSGISLAQYQRRRHKPLRQA